MSQKKQAWKFGRFAEELAAWHLRFRGYRIVARGFRSTVSEIDIVARRGLSDCAAGAFIQSRPALSALDQRFDVILVVPWKLPVHLGDAWRPEL